MLQRSSHHAISLHCVKEQDQSMKPCTSFPVPTKPHTVLARLGYESTAVPSIWATQIFTVEGWLIQPWPPPADERALASPLAHIRDHDGDGHEWPRLPFYPYLDLRHPHAPMILFRPDTAWSVHNDSGSCSWIECFGPYPLRPSAPVFSRYDLW